MKRKSIIKNTIVLMMVFIMSVSLMACGSKKTKKSNTASSGEIKDIIKEEKESTQETKIYLENTSDKEITIVDESGNEINLSKGETLAIEEKSTDKSGEEVYILTNGSTVKVSEVSQAAKEITTVNKISDTTGNKETEKVVLDNVKNNTIQTHTEKHQTTVIQTTSLQNRPVTQPQTQPATQPQTQPATQPQTQPATQPQTQPVTQPQTQPATQPQTQPTTQPQVQPYKNPDAKPGYTGYRQDLDKKAAKLIIELRDSEAAAAKNPTWNEHLYKVAQARAKECASYFSHDSAGNYRSGYACGEALAVTQWWIYDEIDWAEDAIGLWIDSPDHHDIITQGDQYAVACYQNGNYLYWVFIGGTESFYIAENQAHFKALYWGEPGTPKYEEKYKKYYDSFTREKGERIIW